MGKPQVQDLLKRINYLEAEIEMQKQILFSRPSQKKDEIEAALQIIAEKKNEINILRDQIKEIDPQEYDQILLFEKAVEDFRKLAAERNFQSIVGRNVGEGCNLELNNGTSVECLIKACDEDSNWTIITMQGEIRDYPAADVAEKYQPPIIH